MIFFPRSPNTLTGLKAGFVAKHIGRVTGIPAIPVVKSFPIDPKPSTIPPILPKIPEKTYINNDKLKQIITLIK